MKFCATLILAILTFTSAHAADPNHKLHIAVHGEKGVLNTKKNGKAYYFEAKEQGLGHLRFFCHNGTKDSQMSCKQGESYFICPDNQADLCFNFKFINSTYNDLVDLVYEALNWYTN